MPKHDECSIYDINCREGRCNHKKVQLEKQKVWRTIATDGHNGAFIWTITQVMGEPFNPESTMFAQCRDNSWILISQCEHYWEVGKAYRMLETKEDWEDLEIIL